MSDKEKKECGEEITDIVETKKDKKFLGFAKNIAKKVGEGIATGAKFVYDKGAKKLDEIKNNIEKDKETKRLEKAIQNQFNSTAIIYTLVIPSNKTILKKIYAQTNYKERLLILYGDVTNLSNAYFIDKNNQKFIVNLIRSNQFLEITIDKTIYKRPVTIIEFDLKNDDETKQQMQTIINNNQVNIIDSTIIKSDIS